MRLLHVTHADCLEHDAGPNHPERPARLRASREGLETAGVDLVERSATAASDLDLERVHSAEYIAAVERLCRNGGGALDPDTAVGPGSWKAALAAAGGGLTALDQLRNGFEGSAFVAVRPPGHHALRSQAMGFCLFNNAAVTAASLRDAGETVGIVDLDVHHGNGTQEMFYRDPNVFYSSIHQYPFYPYAGSLAETGEDEGKGSTVNIPLPAFTAGDVGRLAFKTIILPRIEAFAPDWLIVSAGFDAHARDPLAELRFVESDYVDMMRRLLPLVPANRIIVFLEGGYHLPAIRDSTRAMARTLAGLDADASQSQYQSPEESWHALERARLNHGTGR